MFVDLLNVLLRQLKSIWRIFGAPRIAGDEKALSAIKGAWTEKGRAQQIGSRLTPRIRYALFATSGVFVVGLLEE
jgi:hypothetical protein